MEPRIYPIEEQRKCEKCKKPINLKQKHIRYPPEGRNHDRYFCIPCGLKCDACNEIIYGNYCHRDDGKINYHKECVTCVDCEKKIWPGKLSVSSSGFRCAECHGKLAHGPCVTCKKILKIGEGVRIAGKAYHRECRTCGECEQYTESLITKDKKWLCENCQSKCKACAQPFGTDAIRMVGDEAYHPACFVCVKCQVPLKDKFCRDPEKRPHCPKCAGRE